MPNKYNIADLQVAGESIRVLESYGITAHTLGVEVHAYMDSVWDGLTITASFKGVKYGGDSSVTKSGSSETQYGYLHTAPVAESALIEVGEPLYIGFIGRDGSGKTVLRTPYQLLGILPEGASTETEKPHLPVPDPDEIRTDHTLLLNRDKPDQHPMKAITGLETYVENHEGTTYEVTIMDRTSSATPADICKQRDRGRHIRIIEMVGSGMHRGVQEYMLETYSESLVVGIAIITGPTGEILSIRRVKISSSKTVTMEDYEYTHPTSNQCGMIKADAATEKDIYPCRVGKNGFLFRDGTADPNMIAIKFPWTLPQNMPRTAAVAFDILLKNAGKYFGMKVQDDTKLSDGKPHDKTLALLPFTYYKFGLLSSLSITDLLAVPATDLAIGIRACEYAFEFQSPAGKATTLTTPSYINWLSELKIDPGRTYLVIVFKKFGTLIAID